MSDQDVFNETKTDTTPEQTNQETTTEENKSTENTHVDVFVEKLMEITREDGTPKYETVTDALDALKHSQEHIRRIEEERKSEKERIAELEREAAEAITLRETIERLSKKNMTEEKPKSDTPTSGGLSEEKVVELFEQMQSKKQQEATMATNLKTVSDTLASKYGEKATEVVKTKAAELGMTLEELKAFSAQKPNAVLALFGEAPKKAPTPNASSTYVPPKNDGKVEIQRPEKSLLSGPAANDKNRIDHIRRIKEKVYKENGINI